VINNLFHVGRRHPRMDRPLVAYDVVFVMGPGILSGTVLGVLLNGVAPGWILAVLIAAVLAAATWSTARKTLEIYDSETREAAAAGEDDSDGGGGRSDREEGVRRPLLDHGGPGKAGSGPGVADAEERLAALLERERGHDLWAIGALVAAWAVISSLCIIKAGVFLPLQVACGSGPYWLLALLPLAIYLVAHWFITSRMLRIHDEKISLGYRFAEGDMRWTVPNVHLVSASGLFFGITAGALGSGGGMLLGPFLLEFGMQPLVAMATTSFFVVFTTATTTVQYILLGQLTVDYALFFSAVGAVGAAVGNVGLTALVRWSRRSWYLVAIMCALLAVSMVLMTWVSWVDLHSFGAGPRDICEPKM